jgi:mono/diheme cytochrome c family protein
MDRGLTLIAVSIVALACGGAALSEPSAARGRALVEEHCVRCHAIGESDASLNKDAPAFRDLNTRFAIDDLPKGFNDEMRLGHPQMPEFLFMPWEAQDIVAYLKHIQGRKNGVAPSPPALGGAGKATR